MSLRRPSRAAHPHPRTPDAAAPPLARPGPASADPWCGSTDRLVARTRISGPLMSVRRPSRAAHPHPRTPDAAAPCLQTLLTRIRGPWCR